MENKSEEKNLENAEKNNSKLDVREEKNLENAEKNNSKLDGSEENLQLQLKETEDKLWRSLAEIENQRRRFEKEIKDAFEYGGFNFAKETIALLDNLQRAQVSMKNDSSLKENKDLDKFLKNIEILEKDIISIFEKNKINKIKCLNEKFDPNLHQAMLEIENEDVDPGTIIQEIQSGFFYGERLLRPSVVGVAKKKPVKKEEKKNDDSLVNEKITPI